MPSLITIGTLNLNKTQILEFRTNHYNNDIIQSAYDLKGITNATEARFLALFQIILYLGKSILNR
jgi:hypothetical protein